MAPPVDLTGRRFGRLVVLRNDGRNKWGRSQWLCACDCGVVKTISGNQLQSGNSVSCGCYQRDTAGARWKTHGQSGSRAYGIWTNMVKRCENVRCAAYRDYGGRGIKVCERWRSFEYFLADMGHPPDGMTLERMDRDGDYEPANCKWATRTEQTRNRKSTVTITYKGATKPIAQWAEELSLSYSRLRGRIAAGWSPAAAIETACGGHRVVIGVTLALLLWGAPSAAQQTHSTQIVWGQAPGEARGLDFEWHFHLDPDGSGPSPDAYAFTIPLFSANATGLIDGLEAYKANVSPMPIGATLTAYGCKGIVCGAVSNALIVPLLPTPTETRTATPSRSATMTATLSPTRTGTATASAVPTPSSTHTRTATPAPTNTVSPIPATSTPAATNTAPASPPSAPALLILEHAFGKPTIAVVQRTQTPGPTP